MTTSQQPPVSLMDISSGEFPGPILVVSAHPDDVDFGAGGTVAALTSKGIEVSYCIVTDGAKGALDPTIAPDDLVKIRQLEQRAAAETLGVSEVFFLGYIDGCLEPTIELRRDFTRIIRRQRPQRIICQSPERNWSRIHASHPDHLAAGEAVLRSVYPDARNPFAYPELLEEGLEPHVVEEVWMMASSQPTGVVDVTETFELKLAALRCHESQLGAASGLSEMIRGWLRDNAARANLTEGRLAEAFHVVDTR
ncbi:MAG: PIG-L deacetylase family protein [Acidimicrobiales bacterium]